MDIDKTITFLENSFIKDLLMKDDITDLAVEIAEHVIGDAVPRHELTASAQKHTDVFVDAEVRKSE